jgi:hypothetical protein
VAGAMRPEALPQADLSKPVGLNRKDFILDLELDSVDMHFSRSSFWRRCSET